LICAVGSYALNGQSAALVLQRGVTTPTKVGGDDVPRVEIWERRKKDKRKDEDLEQLIRESYYKITNPEEPAEIVEIPQEVSVPPVSGRSYDPALMARAIRGEQIVLAPPMQMISRTELPLPDPEDTEEDDIEVLMLLS
jgi:hypothetical protein